MLRRWLIRVPCLVALAFVVSVWIVSYFGAICAITWPQRRALEVKALKGLVVLDVKPPSHVNLSPGQRAAFESSRIVFERMGTPANMGVMPTKFGFYFGTYHGIAHAFEIVFPLWLPTLLLTLLNWFVWRKTRAKYNGRGFPVEVGKKTEG
jgi:hypothetical protein